jgi:hypothetical protein
MFTSVWEGLAALPEERSIEMVKSKIYTGLTALRILLARQRSCWYRLIFNFKFI